MPKAKEQRIQEPQERVDPETGEVLNLPATASQFQVPAEMEQMLDQYAGAGFSDKQEDALTPVLAILQDQSGEIKSGDRHLDGVKAGDFIIRSRRMVFPGDPGILVQPFYFDHQYIEWTGEVGDGVPVGRFMFDDPPEDMKEFNDPQNPNKKILRRTTTQNRLVDTRNHYVNLYDEMTGDVYPVVVPMTGSNHGASRGWTDMMKHNVRNGKALPAFSRLYRLKTTFRKRGNTQSWFGYQIDPSRYVDPDMFKLGVTAFESVKTKPLVANLGDMAGPLDDAEKVAHHSGVDAHKVI